MCCGLSLSGPGAEPGLKARMLASIVVVDTEIGSGELSGGGGICRSWGGGGCRSLRASKVSALTGASVESEHKTRTAPETSPSDSFFSTEALMLRASDLSFATCRAGGVGESMVDAEVEADIQHSTWRLMIVVRDTFRDDVVLRWGAARAVTGKENSFRQAAILALPLSFEQASSS